MLIALHCTMIIRNIYQLVGLREDLSAEEEEDKDQNLQMML